MSKDLKNAGIIASEGRSEDSIFFNAVVVIGCLIGAIGYLIGVIVAVTVKIIGG